MRTILLGLSTLFLVVGFSGFSSLTPMVATVPTCIGDGMSGAGVIECVGSCPDKDEDGTTEEGSCIPIDKTLNSRKYQFCACVWNSSQDPEPACCHLIVWKKTGNVPATPDKRGDCISCQLTGNCKLDTTDNSVACINPEPM